MTKEKIRLNRFSFFLPASSNRLFSCSTGDKRIIKGTDIKKETRQKTGLGFKIQLKRLVKPKDA